MYYIKNHKIRHSINSWIRAWVEIAEALICILTLGFVRVGWSFEIAYRQLKRDAKESKKNRKI